MASTFCPSWLGFFHIHPFRRFVENPDRIFRPLVRKNMTVLEPGCGMGFFTLPLARMVGPQGKVVAIDIQTLMLSVLERRARRANLLDRIELRLAEGPGLGVEDLAGKVDFAAGLHMVHEVADPDRFFREIRDCLKPGSKFLLLEPSHRVSRAQFESCLSLAEKVGFFREAAHPKVRGRVSILRR